MIQLIRSIVRSFGSFEKVRLNRICVTGATGASAAAAAFTAADDDRILFKYLPSVRLYSILFQWSRKVRRAAADTDVN